MRAVIAMMKHETNTFSPVPTPLERFGKGSAGPAFGRAAYDTYKGTGTPMAAYIDLAEQAGAEIITPIAAEAWPSAPVEDAAYTTITDAICEAVEKGCDAVLLDLHGAMVTERLEDGEGMLLERVRKLAPDVPIAAAFDMHTNLTEKIVRNATAVAGYQTYPHVDMYETGLRAGRPVFGALKGEVRPRMAWGNRPMLPHVMRQGTDDLPNRELQAMARRMEAEGAALAATVFVGFPHADIHDAGLSAVVVTDGDERRARSLCEELLDEAWAQREAFVYEIEPLEQSVARAREMTEGPVILLDHYDNTGSGGTMDTTRVLAEVMRQGLEDAVFFAIRDPASVDRLIEAGIGNQATVDLGGKLDMPALGLKGDPLQVTGRVKLISDGRFTIRGPMYTGVRVSMGRTVVLETGKLDIVVLEHHHEPWDVGCLQSLGIDPRTKRYVVLKSRIHYRAGFKPMAKALIECAGVGVCTSDYGQLTFRRVRRPIYPLDLINEPAPRG
jgi:microcystin degradation protein MlrC